MAENSLKKHPRLEAAVRDKKLGPGVRTSNVEKNPMGPVSPVEAVGIPLKSSLAMLDLGPRSNGAFAPRKSTETVESGYTELI